MTVDQVAGGVGVQLKVAQPRRVDGFPVVCGDHSIVAEVAQESLHFREESPLLSGKIGDLVTIAEEGGTAVLRHAEGGNQLQATGLEVVAGEAAPEPVFLQCPRGRFRHGVFGIVGIEAQAVVIRLDAENGGSHGGVVPDRGTGEPGDAPRPVFRAVGAVRGLADRVGLHLPDFRDLVETRRQDIVEVLPCAFREAGLRGGHDRPSLRVVENARVFLRPGIEQAPEADQIGRAHV